MSIVYSSLLPQSRVSSGIQAGSQTFTLGFLPFRPFISSPLPSTPILSLPSYPPPRNRARGSAERCELLLRRPGNPDGKRILEIF